MRTPFASADSKGRSHIGVGQYGVCSPAWDEAPAGCLTQRCSSRCSVTGQAKKQPIRIDPADRSLSPSPHRLRLFLYTRFCCVFLLHPSCSPLRWCGLLPNVAQPISPGQVNSSTEKEKERKVVPHYHRDRGDERQVSVHERERQGKGGESIGEGGWLAHYSYTRLATLTRLRDSTGWMGWDTDGGWTILSLLAAQIVPLGVSPLYESSRPRSSAVGCSTESRRRRRRRCCCSSV